ncbi:glycine cleavage T-protein; aminomethyltransferase [Cyanobium sp. PCC 7001]|uniref:CAF17-like 4Fe-4S cluster assembly/insertion protein YgfZ n=1 Tax=Cyanobium sp. PCC 7001 TaxID=180281 RepID=UPI0001804DE3|nr:glycine cleavage system protein T [Cyanobium sp. PCC 7001]EDY37297.1 glycine cleavage T-protein; aminomethyltransferase [Cyanobium sp. PCC 7001]
MPTPWNWRPSEPARLERPVTLLRLEGTDSRRFLHGQTSAAIELAPPGAWIPTCCISPTGRMRALAEVLVDGEGAWLVVSAGDGEAVRSALDRVLFPADQVGLGTLEPARLITVLPPVSPDSGPMAAPAAPLSWGELGGGVGWRLGASWLLRDGAPLPAELAALPALGDHDQERWRLQQGLPAASAELNDDTNPFELGLADRVSLSKGCYVGQETLAKLATYDGVKQQLRRWHWCQRPEGSPAAATVPEPGTVLLHPDNPDGGRAGRVTSALQLDGGDWIGLALVRRQALEAPALLLGPEPGAGLARLSVPEAFTPPPVGSGSQGR